MSPKTEDTAVKSGQAAVVNGAVEVKAPAAGGQAALLKPGEGVTLLVNGAKVEESCRVMPGDKIEINPVEYIEPFRVDVRVSADAMQAQARFTPPRKVSHTIIDQPFAATLVVAAQRREEPVAGGSVDELKAALAAADVRFGIDPAALEKAMAEPGVWHTVAVGVPPVEGQHGYVEPLFQGVLKPVTYAPDELRVDFRERYEIEQVNPGDPIAVVHPPVPGKPGQAVTGKRIEPKPVRPAVVRCGEGATLGADGRITATRKGVPSAKKGRSYFFQVDDVYIHKGDIDMKSGNANFKGHLEIEGNILEGMKVFADGNIVVGGSAAGATVLAGGSIVFKKQCIKCEVRAGWKDTIIRELYDELAGLGNTLGLAVGACAELVQALKASGKYNERMETPLVRSLLQSKFNDIFDTVARIAARVKKVERILPGPMLETIHDLLPHFLDFNSSQALDRFVLDRLHKELIALLANRSEDCGRASITASYVQNSSLTCTGDILIIGSGVYGSRFKCGGEVRIEQAFRGGLIEAGGSVTIGVAGSPRLAGESGQVKVPKDASVCLGCAYENFRVYFGDWEYRCSSTLTNVCLRFDILESTVKITPWKN